MKLVILAVVLVMATTLAACGGDDDGGSEGAERLEGAAAPGDEGIEVGEETDGAGSSPSKDELGDGDDPTAGEGEATSDADDPVDVVIAHLRAVATGDAATACGTLSPSGLREFEQQLRELESDESCEEFVEWLGEFNTEQETVIGGRVVSAADLDSVRFEVDIDGDRAEVSTPGEPASAILERIDDTWLIVSMPDA